MKVSPDEDAELAALRRRAYSADADIFSDPAALARLAELEGLARADTRASTATPAPEEAATEPAEAPSPVADALLPTPSSRRGRGWHTALVAGTAVVAVVLGASAWSGSAGPVAAPDPKLAAAVATAAEGDPPPTSSSSSSQQGYSDFLNRLRDYVLAGASPEVLASRIIRKELRPYGGMNGRSVWAGPSIDGALCLVVSDKEAPVVACAYPSTVEAQGLSIVLPAAPGVGEGEAVFPPGQSIRYTLGPGLAVSAAPAVD